MATNAFVGTGGDGYSVFTEASHGEDLGYVDYEIFKEQIEQADGGHISPVIDHRVKEVFLPRAKGKAPMTFKMMRNSKRMCSIQTKHCSI